MMKWIMLVSVAGLMSTGAVLPLTEEERLVRDFAGLRDGQSLCLTNGTYHITEAMAKKTYLAPSNNQAGEKLVAFALGGRDGVTLDGGDVGILL